MELFIGERGMAPRDFWAMTLPEVRAVLGDPGAARAPDRQILTKLMERYPDG